MLEKPIRKKKPAKANRATWSLCVSSSCIPHASPIAAVVPPANQRAYATFFDEKIVSQAPFGRNTNKCRIVLVEPVRVHI